MSENSMYEREIDLVQMIKYLWKRVGLMVAGAVVGLIVMLGLQLVMNSGAEEPVEEGELTAFEKEMKEYEEDYAQLEMEIANLEKSIEEQVVYNNESILMKINPYNKQSVKGQFYIDSDYQIMPELTYQNINITDSVVRAYQSLASTGELAKYINEHMETSIEERYLNELITLSYSGNSVLDVAVVHTDKETARKIYDLVIACMNESQQEFVKKIGNYTITLLNESESSSVDITLKETQTLNLDTINTLKKTLKEKQDSFGVLVKPTQGMILKLPVIGAFLGVFCVLAIFVVLFLIDTTIKKEQDIALMLELPVLGTVPTIKGTEKEVRKAKKNRKARFMQYGKG